MDGASGGVVFLGQQGGRPAELDSGRLVVGFSRKERLEPVREGYVSRGLVGP